jgi:hypothetical protein
MLPPSQSSNPGGRGSCRAKTVPRLDKDSTPSRGRRAPSSDGASNTIRDKNLPPAPHRRATLRNLPKGLNVATWTFQVAPRENLAASHAAQETGRIRAMPVKA